MSKLNVGEIKMLVVKIRKIQEIINRDIGRR